ncbi:MAG: ABC transporter permease [Oceanidesulfovibrio sp.]
MNVKTMLSNIGVICANTFREAVRDRILYIIAVFVAVMILLSKVLGWISVNEDLKVVSDLGLMALSVFGALVVIFLGTQLIHKEIDKRTIYVILARPVGRGQYVIGKYLGLLFTVFVLLAAMAVFFLAYLFIANLIQPPQRTIAGEGIPVYWGYILLAILFIFLEMIVLTAVATMFSSVSTPVLSAVFTSIFYVVGHLADKIYELAVHVRNPGPAAQELARTGSEAGYYILMGIFYLFPNLNVFNIRNEAVYGIYRHYDYGYPGAIMAFAFFQAVLFLALGILVFRRRNF